MSPKITPSRLSPSTNGCTLRSRSLSDSDKVVYVEEPGGGGHLDRSNSSSSSENEYGAKALDRGMSSASAVSSVSGFSYAGNTLAPVMGIIKPGESGAVPMPGARPDGQPDRPPLKTTTIPRDEIKEETKSRIEIATEGDELNVPVTVQPTPVINTPYSTLLPGTKPNGEPDLIPLKTATLPRDEMNADGIQNRLEQAEEEEQKKAEEA